MFRATLIAMTLVAGVSLASVAEAQNPVVKAADATHNVAKTVGRSLKGDVKTAGSATHHVLKRTGRDIKESVRTTPRKPRHRHHKPGGLNKVARSVSQSLKHVGRKAKAGVHDAGSDAHGALTTSGHDIKASVKPKP